MDQIGKIDNGVKFAFDNLDRAIVAAKSKPSFNYLYPVLRREKYQLKDITKTGDLIKYFEGFSDGKHYHAKEFFDLATASDNSFFPSELMADELRKRFPDEIDHITTVDDFVPGEKYSNGFLSVVLGGSYALSFRLSRDPNFAYIVINSFNIGPNINEWKDNYNVLLFAPPGRFYSGVEGVIKIVERHKDKTILVFDKISANGFTFFGFYHFKGIVDNKVELLRERGMEPDVFKEDTIDNNPPISRLLASKDLIPQIVITDILIQKAIENGIEFSITRVNSSDFSVVFPYGFFNLIGSFEKFSVIVTESINFSSHSRSAHLYTLSVSSYKSYKNVFGWGMFEDEIKNYQQLYYKLLKESLENVRWINSGPSIKTLTKNRSAFYLSTFIVSAISADVESKTLDASASVYKSISQAKMSNATPESRFDFDLVINGYYARIGVDSPIFKIKSSFNRKILEYYIKNVSSDIASRLVFVAFNREQTTFERIDDMSFLVLGMSFVSQLAKLFPTIYTQFLIPEDKTIDSDDSKDTKVIPSSPIIKAGKNYSEALALNISYFKNLVKEGKSISIITGNGVSIPFGSESWNELSNNLLNQLKPRFIESSEEVQNFFGNLSFFTTDFSYDTLCMKTEENLYWRTLKYSIYRRFTDSIYRENTAIKSISNVKLALGDRVKLFTYNYDTFLEGQYTHDNTPKTLKPVLEPGDVENEVIHLHGIFNQSDYKGEGIVLTRSKYFEIYSDSKKSKALNLFIDSLQNNVCLFIGSSMTDMFQMMIIDKACKSHRGKSLIYALLPVDQLKEGAKETIYQYFLKKNIIIIPFKDFGDLPRTILELFDLE